MIINQWQGKKTLCGNYREPGSCAYLDVKEKQKEYHLNYRKEEKKEVVRENISLRYLNGD